MYLGRDLEIRYTGPGYPGFYETLRDPRVNRIILFRGVGRAEVEPFGFRQAQALGSTLIMER